jgi:hypothetical protein
MTSFVYWGFNRNETVDKKVDVEVVSDDIWLVEVNDNVVGYTSSRKDAETYVKSVSMKLVGRECSPSERFVVEENSTDDVYQNSIVCFNKLLLIAFESVKHVVRTYRVPKLNQPEESSEENSN